MSTTYCVTLKYNLSFIFEDGTKAVGNIFGSTIESFSRCVTGSPTEAGNFFPSQPIFYYIQSSLFEIKEIRYPNGTNFVLKNRAGNTVDIGTLQFNQAARSFVVQGLADVSDATLDINRSFNVGIIIVLKQVSPAKKITVNFNPSLKFENNVDASHLNRFMGARSSTTFVDRHNNILLLISSRFGVAGYSAYLANEGENFSVNDSKGRTIARLKLLSAKDFGGDLRIYLTVSTNPQDNTPYWEKILDQDLTFNIDVRLKMNNTTTTSTTTSSPSLTTTRNPNVTITTSTTSNPNVTTTTSNPNIATTTKKPNPYLRTTTTTTTTSGPILSSTTTTTTTKKPRVYQTYVDLEYPQPALLPTSMHIFPEVEANFEDPNFKLREDNTINTSTNSLTPPKTKRSRS